jgi:hypothetical protein
MTYHPGKTHMKNIKFADMLHVTATESGTTSDVFVLRNLRSGQAYKVMAVCLSEVESPVEVDRVYRPHVGETIESVAEKLVQLVLVYGLRWKCKFNGVDLIAYPGQSANTIVRLFHKAMEDKRQGRPDRKPSERIREIVEDLARARKSEDVSASPDASDAPGAFVRYVPGSGTFTEALQSAQPAYPNLWIDALLAYLDEVR